jgi:murein DD-endopeptidase MepM/ murein hydrolase activator NlpD
MPVLALLILVLLAGPAHAEPPIELALPIDCTPGVDCWPIRYVDHDEGPGVRDYACDRQTGDGHRGTDIAIRDLAVMAEGVTVRAAAPGAIAGRECGNGIRLDHGDGWTTWYCHLRRGSLRVQEGDVVAAGQPLALVGLSGETSFPHLHFDVRKDDRTIDPFVGTAGAEGCGPGAEPLWPAEIMAGLAHRPARLTNLGFASAAPEWVDVKRGWHQEDTLPATSPVLVLWVEMYWAEEGDRLTLTILGPDGAPVVDEGVTLDEGRRRTFRFVGRKRPGAHWPPGTYLGRATLIRPGAADTPLTLERALEIPAE